MNISAVSSVNFAGKLRFVNKASMIMPENIECMSDQILKELTINTNDIKSIKKKSLNAVEFLCQLGVRDPDDSKFETVKTDIKELSENTSFITLKNNCCYKINIPYEDLISLYEKSKLTDETFEV